MQQKKKKGSSGGKIVNQTIVNVHMPESENSEEDEECGCQSNCWGRSSKCGGYGAENQPKRRVVYRKNYVTGSGFTY